MNYLNRQKKESYPEKTISAVWDQYEDYMSMSKLLGKHMDDALAYRPRDLKRRHNEVNAEAELHKKEIQRKQNEEQAKRQAEEMRKKYPGYEDILSEIREKFEYGNSTYCIVVPKNFMEITAEGMALHHCVGNTERYFDRIVSRETYICFLRQQSSPEEPFYTIEVEPGGTIRQHRGEYDEEPGIEEVKPFLREWQKVIRKRMSKKDHEYAAQSEILRQKNIEELKAKNNTVVLKGLAEDLMEVNQMYFEEKEEKQCEINELTLTEGKVYILRFRNNETIKWAHVKVDEIGEGTLTFRTGANYAPITACQGDVLEVYAGGEIPKVFDGDPDAIERLYRGEMYLETEKRFAEGDR